MSPPPDSLEAALRAVPRLRRHQALDDATSCCEDEPDYAALTAAAREWIRVRLNTEMTHERVTDAIRAYARDTAVSGDAVNVDYYTSTVLADVAQKLGL